MADCLTHNVLEICIKNFFNGEILILVDKFLSNR